MKMYTVCCRFILFFAVLFQGVYSARAQNGDQILDGIGETGMVARYVFDGDFKDWSRNSLHAKFHGNEAKFIKDERFGKVLSLSGDHNAFVSLPADALTDLESLSLSGWIFLRSEQAGQRFFDFGKDANQHFFAAPAGTKDRKGYQVALSKAGTTDPGAMSQSIPTNKWVHLAIVIDVASKTMVTYVDSKPVGETKNIPLELTAVFSQQGGKKPLLYVGKSLTSGDPNLNALIHDFRIYRVPLSRKQVASVYFNALKVVREDVANMGKAEDNLPQFAANTPQLYNSYLLKVADVAVETELGNLPRLPSYTNGTYRNNMDGPKVRVLWPADKDNTAVLKPGRYTITGRVAGTDFKPKAVVTVKASGKSSTPGLKLAAFDLNQVALKTDAQQQETKFVENSRN